MKREDIISYLKMAACMLMVFPLIHAFFALDFGLYKGGLIATGIYFSMLALAIPMYNYLQYGLFRYWISDRKRANRRKV